MALLVSIPVSSCPLVGQEIFQRNKSIHVPFLHNAPQGFPLTPGVQFKVSFVACKACMECSACPHHTDFTFSHAPTCPLNSRPLVLSLPLPLDPPQPQLKYVFLTAFLDSPFPLVLKLQPVPWISDQLSYPPSSSTGHFRPLLP